MRWIFPRWTLPRLLPSADTHPRPCGHTFPRSQYHKSHSPEARTQIPNKTLHIPPSYIEPYIHTCSTFYIFLQCTTVHSHAPSISSKTLPHVPLSPTSRRHLSPVPSLTVLLPRSSNIHSACLWQSPTLFFFFGDEVPQSRADKIWKGVG